MIKIKFENKSNDFNDTINSLNCIRNIYIENLSENSAIIIMPENYFEIFSHTLEYFGKITII